MQTSQFHIKQKKTNFEKFLITLEFDHSMEDATNNN